MKTIWLLVLVFVSFNIKADVVILMYGDVVTGQITATNEGGLDMHTTSGLAHYSTNEIGEIRRESDEPVTTNRIPSWVKVLSQLSTNDWCSDLKQIPATVIDNGILKDVPYTSFHCKADGYEVNIYGDPENPAGVEIGAIGWQAGKTDARKNCLDFMSQILTSGVDGDLAGEMNIGKKDLRVFKGLTFETTLPDEPDAYNGWWISVYDTNALDNARATGDSLAKITQPKKKPVYGYTDHSAEILAANRWSDADMTHARTMSDNSSGDRTVYVRGYTRSNGTYVQGYYRSR